MGLSHRLRERKLILWDEQNQRMVGFGELQMLNKALE